MTVATAPPPAESRSESPLPAAQTIVSRRKFVHASDWHEALGFVPLDRIVFDPWPGTATEADLLELVERDKRLCELIDGTLVEKPVGLQEATVAGVVLGELRIWNKANRNVGVPSGADSTLRMASVSRVRLPDVCFFLRERLPNGLLPREKVPALSPDLAVEVLSESNTPQEMAQKLREYFANGTRLAWLVDPDRRTVAVHIAPGEPAAVLGEADVLDGGDVLPGFALPVAELFADLPGV